MARIDIDKYVKRFREQRFVEEAAQAQARRQILDEKAALARNLTYPCHPDFVPPLAVGTIILRGGGYVSERFLPLNYRWVHHRPIHPNAGDYCCGSFRDPLLRLTFFPMKFYTFQWVARGTYMRGRVCVVKGATQRQPDGWRVLPDDWTHLEVTHFGNGDERSRMVFTRVVCGPPTDHYFFRDQQATLDHAYAQWKREE